MVTSAGRRVSATPMPVTLPHQADIGARRSSEELRMTDRPIRPDFTVTVACGQVEVFQNKLPESLKGLPECHCTGACMVDGKQDLARCPSFAD